VEDQPRETAGVDDLGNLKRMLWVVEGKDGEGGLLGEVQSGLWFVDDERKRAVERSGVCLDSHLLANGVREEFVGGEDIDAAAFGGVLEVLCV
jgi:hypothetical protein